MAFIDDSCEVLLLFALDTFVLFYRTFPVKPFFKKFYENTKGLQKFLKFYGISTSVVYLLWHFIL